SAYRPRLRNENAHEGVLIAVSLYCFTLEYPLYCLEKCLSSLTSLLSLSDGLPPQTVFRPCSSLFTAIRPLDCQFGCHAKSCNRRAGERTDISPTSTLDNVLA